VFDRPCAPNELMLGIAADEIAVSRGKSYTANLATAHAVFPRFYGSKFRIRRIADAEIAVIRGSMARNSRAAYDHGIFARSWLLN